MKKTNYNIVAGTHAEFKAFYSGQPDPVDSTSLASWLSYVTGVYGYDVSTYVKLLDVLVAKGFSEEILGSPNLSEEEMNDKFKEMKRALR